MSDLFGNHIVSNNDECHHDDESSRVHNMLPGNWRYQESKTTQQKSRVKKFLVKIRSDVPSNKQRSSGPN